MSHKFRAPLTRLLPFSKLRGLATAQFRIRTAPLNTKQETYQAKQEENQSTDDVLKEEEEQQDTRRQMTARLKKILLEDQQFLCVLSQSHGISAPSPHLLQASSSKTSEGTTDPTARHQTFEDTNGDEGPKKNPTTKTDSDSQKDLVVTSVSDDATENSSSQLFQIESEATTAAALATSLRRRAIWNDIDGSLILDFPNLPIPTTSRTESVHVKLFAVGKEAEDTRRTEIVCADDVELPPLDDSTAAEDVEAKEPPQTKREPPSPGSLVELSNTVVTGKSILDGFEVRLAFVGRKESWAELSDSALAFLEDFLSTSCYSTDARLSATAEAARQLLEKLKNRSSAVSKHKEGSTDYSRQLAIAALRLRHALRDILPDAKAPISYRWSLVDAIPSLIANPLQKPQIAKKKKRTQHQQQSKSTTTNTGASKVPHKQTTSVTVSREAISLELARFIVATPSLYYYEELFEALASRVRQLATVNPNDGVTPDKVEAQLSALSTNNPAETVTAATAPQEHQTEKSALKKAGVTMRAIDLGTYLPPLGALGGLLGLMADTIHAVTEHSEHSDECIRAFRDCKIALDVASTIPVSALLTKEGRQCFAALHYAIDVLLDHFINNVPTEGDGTISTIQRVFSDMWQRKLGKHTRLERLTRLLSALGRSVLELARFVTPTLSEYQQLSFNQQLTLLSEENRLDLAERLDREREEMNNVFLSAINSVRNIFV